MATGDKKVTVSRRRSVEDLLEANADLLTNLNVTEDDGVLCLFGLMARGKETVSCDDCAAWMERVFGVLFADHDAIQGVVDAIGRGLDASEAGRIGHDEFRSVLELLRRAVAEEESRRDEERTALHDFDAKTRAKLRRVFDDVDEDESGFLDKNELVRALAKWGVAKGLADEDVLGLIARFDADKSGTLDFNEFCGLAAAAVKQQDGDSDSVEMMLRTHFARETARIKSLNLRQKMAVDCATLNFFNDQARLKGTALEKVTIERAVRHAKEAMIALGGGDDIDLMSKVANHMRCRAAAEVDGRLQEAAEGGDDKAVSPLVVRGADKDCRRNEPPRETPLLLALGCRHLHVAKTLLLLGAKASICDDYGNSPLLLALINGPKQGDTYLLELLTTAETINKRSEETGLTPLTAAAAKKLKAGVLEWLIKRGAGVDERDAQGRTALMIAAQHGDRAACDVLIAKNCLINALDPANKTALDRAIIADRHAVAEFLRSHGARPGADCLVDVLSPTSHQRKVAQTSSRRLLSRSLGDVPHAPA